MEPCLSTIDFWQLTIGNVLTLVGMVLGFLIWWLKYDHRLVQAEDNDKSIAENLSRISEVIERMDEQGTRYSSKTLGLEQEIIRGTQRRIEALEDFVKNYGPQIAETRSDVSWIKAHVLNGIGTDKIKK